MFKSQSMYSIQDNSVAECARERYSDSVLDLATVGCFFTLHEIRLLPRNTHYPEVERQSSRCPAQSTSEKHVNAKLAGFWNKRP